jgi:N4-gp56 family major capsid protein
MATSSWGTNSPEAVKLWSRKLFQEALSQTYAKRFMGKGTDSLCQIVEDTSKGPGDRVRVTLRMLLDGAGIEGDGTLEGNEEALTTYTDDVTINQLRHAVRSGGKMSEQRIPFSVREEARAGLTDWWADRIDTAFFNQLAGYTAQADTLYTGHNVTVAPSTNRWFMPGDTDEDSLQAATAAKEASMASVSASYPFRLAHIDYLVKEAKAPASGNTIIRPIRSGGAEYYVMFVSPEQALELRTHVEANKITWFEVQKSAMQGGRVDNNPIFTGAMGVYNNVVLHESTRMPFGANGTTTVAYGVRTRLRPLSYELG